MRVPTPVPRTSGGSAAGGVSRPRVPQLLPSPAPRVGRSLGGGGLGAEAAAALRIGARIALPELELTLNFVKQPVTNLQTLFQDNYSVTEH